MRKDVHATLREIKADLLKQVRYMDDVSLQVRVYDCDESGEQTFDIEITILLKGKYLNCFVPETYYTEKGAVSRAKAVCRAVRGWVEYTSIEFIEDVEVYSN